MLERRYERRKNFASKVLKKVLPIIVANLFKEELMVSGFPRIIFSAEDL